MRRNQTVKTNCWTAPRLLLLATVAALVGCAGGEPWTAMRNSSLPVDSQRSYPPVYSQQPKFQQPVTTMVRGQDSGQSYPSNSNETAPGGYPRGPMPVSGGDFSAANNYPQRNQSPSNSGTNNTIAQGQPNTSPRTANNQPFVVNQPVGPQPGVVVDDGVGPILPPPGNQLPGPFRNDAPGRNELGLPQNFADIDAFVEEARTGRLMVGAGINSDAGLTGQIVIDERNFDIFAFPRSLSDIGNGTAWRGAGQGFRFEALPGTQLQRYLVSFTEPYFWNGIFSLNASGFYFDRAFFDWTEQRAGGRLGLGYRVTHDLSLAVSGRYENVRVFNPRVRGIPEVEEVLGDSDLSGLRFTLTHDTRDIPFAPTEGHLIELSYEQVFGDFDYPRGDIDYRRYFLIRERPDTSGRHTLSFSFQAGFSGSQTPVFENYFAGGFSTLRGFDFRGASPVKRGVIVGGEFRFIGSVEYLFPITADDMIKGVVFCDYGTVEEKIEINEDNFRVAPGVGLRLFIPAMGPAPLAFDFAFPVAMADTDDMRIFSFFIGFYR